MCYIILHTILITHMNCIITYNKFVNNISNNNKKNHPQASNPAIYLLNYNGVPTHFFEKVYNVQYYVRVR